MWAAVFYCACLYTIPMSIFETLVTKGEYQFSFDASQRQRWFAPLVLLLFVLLFTAVRFFYVSDSLRSTAIILGYSVFFLFVLPLLGTYIVPFQRKYPAVLIFFKIFGIPFAFLGFLTLLMVLP